MKLAIINGPNLNLTGHREPDVYGHASFDDLMEQLLKTYGEHQIILYQSNVEGELINKLHEVGFSFDGIILNAGAYTHTSLAIADAVSAIRTPVIEVHLSNIFAREDYRHVSFVGARCRGSISGLGMKGYELAASFFLGRL